LQLLYDQSLKWVVPEKIHTPPTEEISAGGGEGNKYLFLIIVSHVFWNDPIFNKAREWQIALSV
jgi:hypothetical protein